MIKNLLLQIADSIVFCKIHKILFHMSCSAKPFLLHWKKQVFCAYNSYEFPLHRHQNMPFGQHLWLLWSIVVTCVLILVMSDWTFPIHQQLDRIWKCFLLLFVMHHDCSTFCKSEIEILSLVSCNDIFQASHSRKWTTNTGKIGIGRYQIFSRIRVPKMIIIGAKF